MVPATALGRWLATGRNQSAVVLLTGTLTKQRPKIKRKGSPAAQSASSRLPGSVGGLVGSRPKPANPVYTPKFGSVKGFFNLHDTLSGMPPRTPNVAFAHSRNIDEHVAYIARMVEKSLKDPESRKLAVKIVSNKVEWRTVAGQEAPYVQAWGRWYVMPKMTTCPPRNDECEIQAIWNFMVLNCRYVFDTNDRDVFATLKESLEAGGGDCDDATIAFATLLRAIGFDMRARVISTIESPGDWSHIYPMVGLPKAENATWLPLDITVTGAVPGWEYADIAKYRDYQM